MTKNDLVKEIAERTECNRGDVAEIIETLLEVVKSEIAAGKTLYLRGFGTLGPKLRAPKLARNLSTKTTILVPARMVPYFKPSREFKEMMR